jgi:hypothetical protein
LFGSGATIALNQFTANIYEDIWIKEAVPEILIHGNNFSSGGISRAGLRVDRSNYSQDRLNIWNNNFSSYTGTAVYPVNVDMPDIREFGGFYFIKAEDNYWNHASGPNDTNPPGLDGDYNNGSGHKVGAGVDYKPIGQSPY